MNNIKKIIALLLVSIMSMSLAACGGGSESGNNETTATGTEETITEETSESDGNVIIIDPVYIPIDDDNITMEITSVSKDIWNEGNPNAESVHYYVNYTVTNKTNEYDVQVSVAMGDCSVGKYTVDFSNMNNETKAGKINDSACFICTASNASGGLVSSGAEHIESLEDLLQFEADVRVDVYEDDGKSRNIKDNYKVPVSLINRDSADSESDDSVKQLSIGDMAKTDVVEMTLDSYLFGYKLALGSENAENYHLPTTENKGLAAGEGNTYFVFDFTVKNIAKNSIAGSDICGMDSKNRSSLWTLDYNDGYTFDDGDYADLNLVVGGNYNYSPVMDPLSTSHFRGIIKCNEEVETNDGAPLILHVILPTSTGTEAFDYVIR